MSDNPLLTLVFFGITAYLFKLWLDDYHAQRKAGVRANSLPGALPTTKFLILLGIIGALFLVLLETAGEYALGVSAEQTDIAAIALLALVAAGFGEELIFRGFLFIDGRGPRILWMSIVGFSVLFALLHVNYYLTWEDDAPWYAFSLDLNAKAAWTLSILFLNSLWFYFLRFGPLNGSRSLLPCIIAHTSSNVAVFGIKLMQGHVVGLY